MILVLGILLYIEHSQGELSLYLAIVAGFGIAAWGSFAIFGDWPSKVPDRWTPELFSFMAGVFAGLTVLTLLTPDTDIWTKVFIFAFLGTWLSYRRLSRERRKRIPHE